MWFKKSKKEFIPKELSDVNKITSLDELNLYMDFLEVKIYNHYVPDDELQTAILNMYPEATVEKNTSAVMESNKYIINKNQYVTIYSGIQLTAFVYYHALSLVKIQIENGFDIRNVGFSEIENFLTFYKDMIIHDTRYAKYHMDNQTREILHPKRYYFGEVKHTFIHDIEFIAVSSVIVK